MNYLLGLLLLLNFRGFKFLKFGTYVIFAVYLQKKHLETYESCNFMFLSCPFKFSLLYIEVD